MKTEDVRNRVEMMSVDFSKTGVGGLDVGSPILGRFYWILEVHNSKTGERGFMASLSSTNSICPNGFSVVNTICSFLYEKAD